MLRDFIARLTGITVKIKSSLNSRARHIFELLYQLEHELNISHQLLDCRAMVCDFGVHTRGGLRAGIHLAEICLAGLADVRLSIGQLGPEITVSTDHPLAACMASQYAGWQISNDQFFAMGSGPMRVAANKEALLQELGYAEQPTCAVGVLEADQLPPDEICEQLASDCGVSVKDLCLCVAPTTSQAGTIQVVARSIETALHKMHELGYDLNRVESGLGAAPLPPVASSFIGGIGRTNDAVLYGARVTLWVQDEDEDNLRKLVEKIPSSASRDYGVPFAETFARYNGDFYQIDPHLFSPAVVTIVNHHSGNSFTAGAIREDLLQQSFLSETK